MDERDLAEEVIEILLEAIEVRTYTLPTAYCTWYRLIHTFTVTGGRCTETTGDGQSAYAVEEPSGS